MFLHFSQSPQKIIINLKNSVFTLLYEVGEKFTCLVILIL